jgi:hypothetical protein
VGLQIPIEEGLDENRSVDLSGPVWRVEPVEPVVRVEPVEQVERVVSRLTGLAA